MADLIVAFPKLADAKNLRKLLVSHGYDVTEICDSGAQIIEAVNRLDGGVVISGYRFSDMYYREIHSYLPKSFQLLLLATPAKLSENDVRELITLAMPFKVQDLLNTIDMMMVQYKRWEKKQKKKPKKRSEDDEKIIAKCKELLMERNGMTEEEAHHYIQKMSMDGGNSMVETAQMLMMLESR